MCIYHARFEGWTPLSPGEMVRFEEKWYRVIEGEYSEEKDKWRVCLSDENYNGISQIWCFNDQVTPRFEYDWYLRENNFIVH